MFYLKKLPWPIVRKLFKLPNLEYGKITTITTIFKILTMISIILKYCQKLYIAHIKRPAKNEIYHDFNPLKVFEQMLIIPTSTPYFYYTIQ